MKVDESAICNRILICEIYGLRSSDFEKITFLWYVTPCRLYKGTYFFRPQRTITTNSNRLLIFFFYKLTVDMLKGKN
jgi:hypothetical protein